MLPRWHIALGALFTIIIWVAAPATNPLYLGILFAASFLIDFDHYVVAAIKQKKVHLKHALAYHRKIAREEHALHKKGIRKKGDFHLFHTVEFHALIAIVGIFFLPFFYMFIGMMFHSLLDLGDLLHKNRFYRREYFLTNWLRKQI